MTIPTEPIDSIPRTLELIEAVAKKGSEDPGVVPLYGEAGVSPFSDHTSTSRDVAFAKIRSRVLGIARATDIIGARS